MVPKFGSIFTSLRQGSMAPGANYAVPLLVAVVAVVGTVLAGWYLAGRRQKHAANTAKEAKEVLPHVRVSSILEQKQFGGRPFPLVLEPSDKLHFCTLDDVTQMLRRSRSEIDQLLLSHKAILFRGFPVEGPDEFNAVAEALDYGVLEYVGGAAVRTQLARRVFTANEAPATEKIPFHHEMAQVPRFPTHLLFYADIPAETGGETPILPSSEVCRRLEQRFPAQMRKLEQTGVQYVRVMPDQDDASSAIGRSWRSTFLTEDKPTAESKLQQLGSSWEWLGDGNLKTVTAVLPAIKVDEGPHRTNEKVFFNSMVAAYTGWKDSRNDPEKAVIAGDGTPIDPIFIQAAADIMEEICVAFTWQRGDVLLLDNRTVMHSRRSFTGKRRILASLGISPER